MLDRRGFLKSAASLGGFVGLQGLVSRPALGATGWDRTAANQDLGYGPLKKTAAKNTGEVLLELPDGFEYNVFGKTGDALADGHKTPGAHDGMAAFQINGKVRLVRNHEVRADPSDDAHIGAKEKSYDFKAGGGTTTLIVDPETRELEKAWVSLSGTLVNCAGGPTPWGSWVTCEETVAGPQKAQVYHKDDREVGGYAMPHGYVFEVPAVADEIVEPQPIKEMGRFVHEAMAIDPVTGIVYLTEDRGTAGFYRFIPNVPGQLTRGGILQMARVVGKNQFDTRKGQKVMEPMRVDWVTIDDVDPANAGEEAGVVYKQGVAKGAATFDRLEGCWYGDGAIFLDATSGGDAEQGQIWRYKPMGIDGGDLTLLFESRSADELESPDNICVSPRGTLVVCEDGDGANRMMGLTQDGRIFTFAQNAFNESEFAGSTFSPDGKTLFVNIQYPGMTLAIWGPWERGSL